VPNEEAFFLLSLLYGLSDDDLLFLFFFPFWRADLSAISRWSPSLPFSPFHFGKKTSSLNPKQIAGSGVQETSKLWLLPHFFLPSPGCIRTGPCLFFFPPSTKMARAFSPGSAEPNSSVSSPLPLSKKGRVFLAAGTINGVPFPFF